MDFDKTDHVTLFVENRILRISWSYVALQAYLTLRCVCESYQKIASDNACFTLWKINYERCGKYIL